jgi:hypothetical protein
MSSSTKALYIDTILDEIIWLSHAGSCRDLNCRNPFSLDPSGCTYQEAHLRALSRCILVCKLWAEIGIPQLWSSYANYMNLLSLVKTVGWDVPQKDWFDKSAIDAEVSKLKLLQFYYVFARHCLKPFLPPQRRFPSTRSQLDRWFFHAEYVRVLAIGGMAYKDYGTYYGEDYFPDSFLTLAHIAERPILPHLKALIAYGSWLNRSSAPLILATILSQSVLHLEIRLPNYGSNHRDILEIIRQRSPKLQYLQVLGDPQPHCNILSKFLPSLRSLQVLRLDPLAGRDFDDFLANIGPNLLQLQILNFQPNENIYALGLPVSTNKTNREKVGAILPSMDTLLLEWKKDICCSRGDILSKTFGHNHPLRFLSVVHKVYTCPRNGTKTGCTSHYCKAIGSAFPFLETFHLKYRQRSNDTSILRIFLEPLLKSTHLTEFSVIGFDVADRSELSEFLTCLPSLVKLEIVGSQIFSLWPDYAPLGISEEFMREFVAEEIAEGGILAKGARGIGLDCLAMIKDHSPRLKELKLKLVASATNHLQQALQPFDNLEKLEFVHSFWNFRQPDFNHGKAACFISSFMNTTTNFVFRKDYSLEDNLGDREDLEDERGRPWLDYSEEYYTFCKQFQEKVGLAHDARLEE